MRERRLALLALLALALLIGVAASGCRSKRGASATVGSSSGSGSGSSTARCKKSYARCRLPGGPLGVCMPTHCAPGNKRPCYRCTPQH